MTHEEIFTYPSDDTQLVDSNFTFGVIGLAHSHIYGMTSSLIKAGAKLKWVYDDNKELIKAFVEKHENVSVATSIDQILSDNEIQLIASADIPSRRANLAIRTMNAGINFFVDKAPCLTLEECDEIESTQQRTGKKYFVYYSELIENDAAIFAKHICDRGVIGKLCHIDIFAPHRLNPQIRPEWFWSRKDTGGIITDIGSHQIEQFLEFANCKNATITSARVNNYFHPEYPEFDDFGDVTIKSENGITGYMRVDWMSPAGIKTFGDLRMTIVGEKGYIELRKNCNLGTSPSANNVFVATDDGVFFESVTGKLPRPYFKKLINDCVTGSNTAMPLDLIYSAMRLTVTAQSLALSNH